MQTIMPSRERFCVYAAPNVSGPAGFAMAETVALRSGMPREARANGRRHFGKTKYPFFFEHNQCAARRRRGWPLERLQQLSPRARQMRGRRQVRLIARLARRGAILCSDEKSLFGQEEFPVFRRNRESAASC